MPEVGRLLRFPARNAAGSIGREEARATAQLYLQQARESGAGDRRQALLDAPDVLLALSSLLREVTDSSAAEVFEESGEIYRAIHSSKQSIGSFDERDYFLGEFALLAGTSARVLGKRADAEIWFDRAEAGFRNTVNAAPLLARVTYQRLALRLESGQFREVSELAPMLATTFRRMGMKIEEAKSVFLHGVALKEGGNHEDSIEVFGSLRTEPLAEVEPGLVGLALINLADIHAADAKFEHASDCYSAALPLLKRADRPAAIAFLKCAMAENLRRQGNLTAAVDAYRASRVDYEALGMATWVAYARVVTAQTLLESDRPREAEWEILAALQTIDEQKMVPEGYAAVAILRESIRMRKTDPAALSELRQYLQANS